MKKLIVFLTILSLLVFYGMPVAAQEFVFTENFSSGNFSKWTNPTLDEDKGTKDMECENVASISNGELYLNNATNGGSFFYLAPKGIKTKNFSVSMDVKVVTQRDSWFGFSVRKDTNDRFNGCNNVLVYFKPDPKGVYFQAARGYPGGGGIVTLDSLITNNKKAAIDVSEYHSYKLVVKDAVYTCYLDDENIGTFTYDKASVNNPGFVSINCCLADIKIKNFKLVSEDAIVDPGISKPVDKPSSADKNTSITSSSYKIDNTKFTISLKTKQVDYNTFKSRIKVASGASFKILKADGKTTVTKGSIVPKMKVRVEAKDKKTFRMYTIIN